MDKKKANQKASQQISCVDNSTASFKFCSGNAGVVQRKIIRHLLSLHDGGLENAGTDAIRAICSPWKNPLEYISKLRNLNGAGCILSIPVLSARLGNSGNVPIYYSIPVNARQSWRAALGVS